MMHYNEAHDLQSKLEISAVAWNTLYWQGSLHGFIKDVMPAGEKAVLLASGLPEEWNVLDSRGLARALTGDLAGAIEDFRDGSFFKGIRLTLFK